MALLHLTVLKWGLSYSLNSKEQEVMPMNRRKRPMSALLLAMCSTIWAIEVGVVAEALPA
jgi:hypothetical protein